MHIVSSIGIATFYQIQLYQFSKKERLVLLAVTILSSVTFILGEIMEEILRGAMGSY